MESSLIYIILGIFDCFAAVLLVLKMYKLPVRKYGVHILCFVVFISLFSFLMRVVLQTPKLDLPFQYLFMIIFFRLFLKMKVHLASFAVGTGLTAYINLQMIVFFFANLMKISPSNVIHTYAGFSIYSIQITSILSAYLLSFLLKRYNLGFTFIVQPPHDFLTKENYFSPVNTTMIVGTVCSTITISFTLVLLYNSDPIWLLTMSIFAFALSYYFSQRGDCEDDRSAVKAYRSKNQKSRS